MPSINDRIGSQNVIRVLSNASAPPSRLLNLTDVESTSQVDGNLLIWDADTSKFVMGRDLDGTEGYVFTGGTGQVGIVTFSGTTPSESTTTGAVIVSGGVAVGKNLNVAAQLNVVGIATFSNEVDINAAVDILRGLNVSGITSVASLNIGATSVITSGRELQNIVSLDATTTATIEAAIELAPNTFTDLKVSGISTFIGIATFGSGIHVQSGVSTFDVAVDIDAGLDVDGQTDLDELVVAGVSTFNNTVDINAVVDIDGQLDVDELIVAGVSTFNNSVDIDSVLDVDGQTNLDELVVAGVSTFNNSVDIDSVLDVDGQTDLDELVVAGVSTYNALVDIDNRLDVVGGANLDQLNVTGVSTFTGDVSFGSTATFGDHDKLKFGDGEDLQIYHSGSASYIRDVGTGPLIINSDNLRVKNVADTENIAWFKENGAVELYYDNVKRFETSGIGVIITGETDINGDLNVSGVATFSSLVDANNRLDVVGGSNLDQLNVVGVSTFGDVSIFNDDLRVTAGGIDVVGVSSFSTHVDVTGTLTAGLIDGGTF